MKLSFQHCRLALSAGTILASMASIPAFAVERQAPAKINPKASATAPGEFVYLDDTNNELPSDGTVEVVRERYPDGKIKVERCVTLDGNKNYVNHGSWKMYAENGESIAEGQYDMGKRVGLWSRFHGRAEASVLNEFPYNRFKTPFISQANFLDGQLDGEWLITDNEKHKVVQVSFKQGRRHGPAIVWLPTGKMYRQSTFDEGVPVGDVLEINPKNNEFERSATYIDGRKMTTKATNYKNATQKKSEESYLAATTVQSSPDDFWTLRFAQYAPQGKDLKHGPAKQWYSNGKAQMSGNYDHDKKSGTFTYWHENGQIAATGEYKEDVPAGLWVWYHDNGLKAAIGKYDEGKLMGEWRWWNEAGQLTKLKTYDGTQQITQTPQEEESMDLGQAPRGSATR